MGEPIPFNRRPHYSVYTQARIQRARDKARATRRRAWLVGQSPYTGATQYRVISASGLRSYYPAAYTHPRMGGYCYAHDGEPLYWISCTCEASREHSVPCWHAANVHLRLAREAREERADEPNEDGQAARDAVQGGA